MRLSRAVALLALLCVGACSNGGGPSAAECNADLAKLQTAETTYFAQNGRYGSVEELAASRLAGPDMLHGVVTTGSEYTLVPIGGKCASPSISSQPPPAN